jgi:hypothetical protein
LSPDRIYIYAATQERGRAWAEHRGLSPYRYIILTRPEQVMGLHDVEIFHAGLPPDADNETLAEIQLRVAAGKVRWSKSNRPPASAKPYWKHAGRANNSARGWLDYELERVCA